MKLLRDYCRAENKKRPETDVSYGKDRFLLCAGELVFDLSNRAAHGIIFFAQLRNFFLCVEDGGMIFTESCTDFIGGAFGQFTAEIHGNHARLSNIFVALFTEQIGDGNAEVRSNGSLNKFKRNVSFCDFLFDLSMEQLFSALNGDF